MLKKGFILLIICLGATLYSNNLDKLHKAIEKIDYDEDTFQYISTSTEEENGEKVELEVSFNPLRDPKSVLVKVDGKKPTEKDIEDFYKELQEEDDEGSIDQILGDKYKLVSNKNGIATYSYTTKESIIPGKNYLMDGVIKVDLEKEEVISISLKNPKDFKINGAKLTVMEMDFIYESFDSKHGVLKEMNFNLEGKFLLVKFYQKSKSQMYDYKLVN